MLRTILAVLFAVCYLIIGIPVLFVEWLIGKKNPHLRDISSLRMVQWAFRVICRICGVKLTVKGQENVPKDIPVLYVANHNSYFDIMITYALCPDLTGYIAKDSLEKVPLLNIWMKRLYCLFLKRDDMKASLKTILQAIEYVKKGISICIFPEGTRNKNEDELDMLPFHEGSFKIAAKANCPIIPMAISGSADIWENHFPRVKKTHVILEYGKPIYIDQLEKEDKKHLGAYTQNIIHEMLVKNKAQL